MLLLVLLVSSFMPQALAQTVSVLSMTGFKAENLSTEQIKLTWNDPASSQRYRIYTWWQEGSTWYNNPSPILTSPQYIVNNVTSGKEYVFRLLRVDNNGNDVRPSGGEHWGEVRIIYTPYTLRPFSESGRIGTIEPVDSTGKTWYTFYDDDNWLAKESGASYRLEIWKTTVSPAAKVGDTYLGYTPYTGTIRTWTDKVEAGSGYEIRIYRTLGGTAVQGNGYIFSRFTATSSGSSSSTNNTNSGDSNTSSSTTTATGTKPQALSNVRAIGSATQVDNAAYNDVYLIYDRFVDHTGADVPIDKVTVYTKVNGVTYSYNHPALQNYTPINIPLAGSDNTRKGVFVGTMQPNKTYTFGLTQTKNGVESDVSWAAPYAITAPSSGANTDIITEAQLLEKATPQSATLDKPASSINFSWRWANTQNQKVSYFLITQKNNATSMSSEDTIGIVQPNMSATLFVAPRGSANQDGTSDSPYQYYIRPVYENLFLAENNGTLKETSRRTHYGASVAFAPVHYPQAKIEQLPYDQLPTQVGCRFYAEIEGASPTDPYSLTLSQKQDVSFTIKRPPAPASTTADDVRYRLLPKYSKEGDSDFTNISCDFLRAADVPTGTATTSMEEVDTDTLLTPTEQNMNENARDRTFDQKWKAISSAEQSALLRAIRIYIDPATYSYNGVPTYKNRPKGTSTAAQIQQFRIDNVRGYLPFSYPHTETCKVTIPSSRLQDGTNTFAVQSFLYDLYSQYPNQLQNNYPNLPYKCLSTPLTLNINVIPAPTPNIVMMSTTPDSTLIEEPTFREEHTFPSGDISLNFTVQDSSNTPLTCKVIDSANGSIHTINNCKTGGNNATLHLTGEGNRTLTLSVTNGIGKEHTKAQEIRILSGSPSVIFSGVPTAEVEAGSINIGLSCTDSSIACKKLEYLVSDVDIPVESLDMFLSTAKECTNATCSITLDSSTSYNKYIVARMITASGQAFYSNTQHIRFSSPHNSGDLPDDPGGPGGLPDGVPGPSNGNTNVSNTNQNNGNTNVPSSSNINQNSTNLNTNSTSVNSNQNNKNENLNQNTSQNQNSENQNGSNNNENNNSTQTNQNNENVNSPSPTNTNQNSSNTNTNSTDVPAGDSIAYLSTNTDAITQQFTIQPSLQISSGNAGAQVTVQYNAGTVVSTTLEENLIRKPLELPIWTLNTDGINTVTVKIRDIASNTEKTVAKTVFQDSKAPVITILSSTIDAVNGTPVWSFEVSDALAVESVRVVATNITTGNSVEGTINSSSSGQYTYAYPGTIYPGHQYRIELYAKDIAGNGGVSVGAISSGITVPSSYANTHNPVLTLIPLTTQEVTGETVDIILRQGSFSYIIRDIPKNTNAVLADLLEAGRDSSGRILSQIPAGSYTVEIRSRVDSSNKIQPLTISPYYFASNGDINGDGVVGLSDYLLSLYGQNKGIYRTSEDSSFLSTFITSIQNAFNERKVVFYRS